MRVVLDNTSVRESLFPFTLTRSVADIRIGIFTIREKWEKMPGEPVTVMDDSFPKEAIPNGQDPMVLPANLVPGNGLVTFLQKDKYDIGSAVRDGLAQVLEFPWQIAAYNDWAIRQDFELLTRDRKSAPLPDTVQAIKPENIFIEEGARLQHCILNASAGPIYMAAGAEIMEGCLVRGPFALCEGAVLKMGTRIYGATTIGPGSIVGGELKNSVIFGYSNKAHDGYLGDAVIGEWCNLGAGTSCSNLKNTAGEVRVWHEPAKDYIPAGLKCGLLMGDYSRCAINTSFNTGTVTGVCANIFGEGLTPKLIPSFSWGFDNQTRYRLDKAFDDINNWKKFKRRELTDNERNLLTTIFERL